MNLRFIMLVLLSLVLLGILSCGSRSKSDVIPLASNGNVPSMLLQAEQFYGKREDLNQLQQGIVLLQQAAVVDPSSYDAYWRLAKFKYYLASHTDGKYQENAFREGINAGKAAVALQPSKPEGHFWLGANYGGSLEAETISADASIGDVRREMQTVLKLDEGYQDGSAYMVLGLLYLKAPRIVGGDPERAVTELEKGLQFGRDNAFLRVHLAEAYQAVGRASEAKGQLNAVLSMTPDPNYLPELKEAQMQARELLQTVSSE